MRRNAGDGIRVYVNRFSGTGKPFSIDLAEHVSRHDLVGFWIGTFVAGASPSAGAIAYVRGTVMQSRDQGVVVRNYDVLGPPILLDGPVVLDPNERGHPSAKYGSGIVL